MKKANEIKPGDLIRVVVKQEEGEPVIGLGFAYGGWDLESEDESDNTEEGRTALFIDISWAEGGSTESLDLQILVDDPIVELGIVSSFTVADEDIIQK
jgi:hypothetical protein